LIAAGGSGFSAALLTDNTVMAWGNTLGGALGRAPWDGGYAPGPVPPLVPGVNGIRAIAAGGSRDRPDRRGDGNLLGIGHIREPGPSQQQDEQAGSHSFVDRRRVHRRPRLDLRRHSGERPHDDVGGLRPWTRPEESHDDLSRYPILLWLDGLDQQ